MFICECRPEGQVVLPQNFSMHMKECPAMNWWFNSLNIEL
jgi:hypothetical protein